MTRPAQPGGASSRAWWRRRCSPSWPGYCRGWRTSRGPRGPAGARPGARMTRSTPSRCGAGSGARRPPPRTTRTARPGAGPGSVRRRPHGAPGAGPGGPGRAVRLQGGARILRDGHQPAPAPGGARHARPVRLGVGAAVRPAAGHLPSVAGGVRGPVWAAGVARGPRAACPGDGPDAPAAGAAAGTVGAAARRAPGIRAGRRRRPSRSSSGERRRWARDQTRRPRRPRRGQTRATGARNSSSPPASSAATPPSPAPDGRAARVDELEKTFHYRHWREDLALVRGAGAAPPALRPALLPHPRGPRRATTGSSPTWSSPRCGGWGSSPSSTSATSGCPIGPGDFQNPDWPALFARYAGAFAARFPWVRFYTPVNEIYVCAKLSALHGLWNERRRGRPGVRHGAQAPLQGQPAGRPGDASAVRPDAIFIQSESAEYFHRGQRPGLRAAGGAGERAPLPLLRPALLGAPVRGDGALSAGQRHDARGVRLVHGPRPGRAHRHGQRLLRAQRARGGAGRAHRAGGGGLRLVRRSPASTTSATAPGDAHRDQYIAADAGAQRRAGCGRSSSTSATCAGQGVPVLGFTWYLARSTRWTGTARWPSTAGWSNPGRALRPAAPAASRRRGVPGAGPPVRLRAARARAPPCWPSSRGARRRPDRGPARPAARPARSPGTRSKGAAPSRPRRRWPSPARRTRGSTTRRASGWSATRCDRLGGMGRFVRHGQTVLIKPNLTMCRLAQRRRDDRPAGGGGAGAPGARGRARAWCRLASAARAAR